MPVVYGSPDLLPTLSVVYACRCGFRITETGIHAGDAPPRWLRVDEGEFLCEHCAAQTRKGAEKNAPAPTR